MDPLSTKPKPTQPSQPTPVSPPPTQPTPAQTAPPSTPTPVPQGKTNTMAIIALIFAFLIPIVGIILAIVALIQIGKRQEKGKGLAIGAVVVAILITILHTIFIFMVLAGVQSSVKYNSTTPTTNTSSSSDSSSSSSSNTQASSTTTVADETLKQDVLKAIFTSEASKGNATSGNQISIVSVQQVSHSGSVYVENWTVSIAGKQSVYTVTLTSTPGGGTDYSIVKKS